MSQPALAALLSRGVSVVGAKGDVASESVAQLLADRELLNATVWVRLDALDAEPHCLVESVLRAAVYASDAPISDSAPVISEVDTRSHAEAGRVLAERLAIGTILVLEDVHVRTVGVLETLVGYTRSAEPQAAAIYLSHRGFRRGDFEAAEVVIDSDSGSDPDVSAALLEDDAGFSVPSLARVVSLVGHHGALLNDILDANANRDPSLVTYLATTPVRSRSLLACITARLLPGVSPAELQALSVASQTGYWHPSLGDRAPPDAMTLRPWMLPLENGWWWLRPMWNRSLSKFLDPTHKASRRFFTAYRPPSENGASSEVIADSVPNSGGVVDSTSGLAQALEIDESGQPGPGFEVHVVHEPAGGGAEPPVHERHDGSALIVRIRMLGSFDVAVGGRPVPKWHGRLGRSILAYLLVQHSRSAAKDRLLDVFWPNVAPTTAQNRLHVAISELRKSLKAVTDRPVVEFDQDGYQLVRSCAVQVDVDEFEEDVRAARRSAARGRIDEALAGYDGALECYRGDLLPDMPYEEWTLLPREALRVAFVECLGDAARLRMSREEYGEALRLGWAILATDSAHEEAHRLIMRCHAASGHPYQALRHFEICSRELATILGVKPAQATVDLLEAIRCDTSPPTIER